ncbi:hypothetical protein [Pseudidiomarina aestuarii]|uniref:hypothetical protein n=1 Tax=Pseudidiomarina aestuarii TaxID=624146 RepID=UPI003A983B1C
MSESNKRQRKPDTSDAMRTLIQTIRDTIPFGLEAADMCQGICRGCSKKMMEMLDSEVSQWQVELDNKTAVPTLADLAFMKKLASRTYKVLQRNNLISG